MDGVNFFSVNEYFLIKFVKLSSARASACTSLFSLLFVICGKSCSEENKTKRTSLSAMIVLRLKFAFGLLPVNNSPGESTNVYIVQLHYRYDLI